jgi:hypothetical protein
MCDSFTLHGSVSLILLFNKHNNTPLVLSIIFFERVIFIIKNAIVQSIYLILPLKLILNVNLPDICEHFEREGVTPKMYFFEWILTLYSKNLNPDIVSRIWDVSFLDDG